MLSYSGSQAIAALTECTHDAHLFAQARTFRIIQLNGLDFSTGSTDLAARARAILANSRGFSSRFASCRQRVGTRCFSSSVQLRTSSTSWFLPVGMTITKRPSADTS